MGALFSTQDNWMINQTQRIAKGTGNFLRKTSEQLVRSEVSHAVRSGAIGRGLGSIGESISKGAKKTANTVREVAQKGRNMFRKNNTKRNKNTRQKHINTKNNAVAQVNAKNPPVASNNKIRSNANTDTGPSNKSNLNEQLKKLNTTNLIQTQPQIATNSGGSRKKSKKSRS